MVRGGFMKKTREEIVVGYLKDIAPCLISFSSITQDFQAFITKDCSVFLAGGEKPLTTLKDLKNDNPDLLFDLFSGQQQSIIHAYELISFEQDYHQHLGDLSLPESEKEIIKEELKTQKSGLFTKLKLVK